MAKVQIEVGLKTTEFQRGLDGLRKMAATFQQQIGKLATGIGNAGRNLANFNIGRLRDNAEAARDFADAINDLADISGESVEGLQKIAYAADQTAGDLEGFVKGMLKANEAALKAAEGNTDAAATFEQLQIDPEKFLTGDMVEQAIALASAFDRLSESGDPTLQFIDLLGAKSKDMIALLRQGKKEVTGIFDAAPLMSADAMKKLDELDRKKKDDAARQRAEAGNAATKIGEGGMAWDKLKRGKIGEAFGHAKSAGGEILKDITGNGPKLANEDTSAKRTEARKRLLKPESKVLDPEERQKLIEREMDVDFQNALSKASTQSKAHMLSGKQNKLFTQSREAEAAGDEEKARELRIEAKGMQGEVDEAYKNYSGGNQIGRSMITSSLQEVGGGGAAVAFGGLDVVMKAQADDIKIIRAIIQSAKLGPTPKLQGASNATGTPSFKKKP